MDTNALKKFAQSARNLLIDQVAAKLGLVLDLASAARREKPEAMKKLDAAIRRDGERQVIEQVAYTWFNRFAAIRYMEIHDYLDHGHRVLSNREGGMPEILNHANPSCMTFNAFKPK